MAALLDKKLADAPWLRSETSRHLLDALTAEGHPARFVGGCVRDGLLGLVTPDTDLDLTTPARPNEIIALLKKAAIKVIPTGLNHGTVTALCGDQVFEITTLREDIDCDGRHAEVRFTDDFRLDAARRDFTINAMSVDTDGKLYDYFNGRKDLALGRIRFVGDADKRVREDYLRILRFFRFFAGYGKKPVDMTALAACRDHKSRINGLSGERIRAEMFKLLCAHDPQSALELMTETDVITEVLPPDLAFTSLTRLLSIEPRKDPILRLAALLRTAAPYEGHVASIADYWRLSNKDRDRLFTLTAERRVSVVATKLKARKDIYRLGGKAYLDLVCLSAAETLDAKSENLVNARGLVANWTSPVMPVNGQDLIVRGIKPGPELGDLLASLEAWWLDHDMKPTRGDCILELETRLNNKA